MSKSELISAKMTIPQAFNCLVQQCVNHIRMHEAGVSSVKNWDVESLHQMRVGIRRLRAVLMIFRKAHPISNELKEEIKWLDLQLGPARDWDVLSQFTLPHMDQFLVGVGLEAHHLNRLMREVNKRAQKEHSHVSAVITAARYCKLMRQLNYLIADQIERSDQKVSLKKFARDAINKSRKRLLKCNTEIKDLNPMRLHQLRIAVKKCHYTTDFFKSLYPKKLKKYITKISGLQDLLGMHNDIIVAGRLLNEISRTRVGLEASINFAQGFLASQTKVNKLHNHRLWNRAISAYQCRL